MDYKIVSYNKPQAHFEISVDADGYNFTVIYGTHRNGGFCAIPNHGIACEMSTPTDTFYNTESLNHRGLNIDVARAIAYAIRDASSTE